MVLVSIITPNFNRAQYLKECVQSVIGQSYNNWEMLIVDDGSTDHSKQIVQHFNDNRLNFIERSRLPKGAATCKNIGLQEAKGDYIIFLDSDDLLSNSCLQNRVSAFQHRYSHLDFLIFPMLGFYKEIGDCNLLWNKPNEKTDIERFIQLDSVWQTTGPIWKKDALLTIIGFNETLHCWQDVELHTKAILSGLKYQYIQDLAPDCYYRKGAEHSITQSNTNTIDKLQSKILVYDWLSQYKNINSQFIALHIIFSGLKKKYLFFILKYLFKRKIRLKFRVWFTIYICILSRMLFRGKLSTLQSYSDQLIHSIIPSTNIFKYDYKATQYINSNTHQKC